MPEPRPIRVLMLNYEFPPFGGGTGRSCAALLDELPRQPGIAVDLVTSGPEETVERRADLPNLRVHRLAVGKRSPDYWTGSELARWTWRAYRRSRRLLRRERFDLLHCWGTWPAGAVGWLLPGNLPMLVSMRGSDVPGYNDRLARLDPIVFQPLARRIWRRATRLVALSNDLRQLALRTAPEAVIDILPNGTDTARFEPRLGHAGRRIVFLGRFIRRKRVDLLIEAVGRLVGEFPDLELTILGDGPCRAALEAQAAACPAADRIRFTGHLEGGELDQHIEAADMLVMPSSREASSYAVLEAMAAGLAVVTTATGAAELLDGNGIVVPVDDVDALVAGLAAYCRDPERLLAHRRRSRELAMASDWRDAAASQYRLYSAMLDRPTPALRSLAPAPSGRSGTCQTVPQRVAPPARR
jgi:L-malate glycosyltransferase